MGERVGGWLAVWERGMGCSALGEWQAAPRPGGSSTARSPCRCRAERAEPKARGDLPVDRAAGAQRCARIAACHGAAAACREAGSQPASQLGPHTPPCAPASAAAGRYLEIFGRKNNLRNYWVTVGNEVTGQVRACSGDARSRWPLPRRVQKPTQRRARPPCRARPRRTRLPSSRASESPMPSMAAQAKRVTPGIACNPSRPGLAAWCSKQACNTITAPSCVPAARKIGGGEWQKTSL